VHEASWRHADPYVKPAAAGRGAPGGSGRAWLDARRAEALERANALAVPTTRDEEWRFTDLTPLTRLSSSRSRAAPGRRMGGRRACFVLPRPRAAGVRRRRFAPALSRPAGRRRRGGGTSLADALTTHAAR
jgi:Fe-S cluster assembly protein SufD